MPEIKFLYQTRGQVVNQGIPFSGVFITLSQVKSTIFDCKKLDFSSTDLKIKNLDTNVGKL